MKLWWGRGWWVKGLGGTTKRCGSVKGGETIFLNCGALSVLGGEEKWMGDWRDFSFWMIRGNSFRRRLRSIGNSLEGKSSLMKWGEGGG